MDHPLSIKVEATGSTMADIIRDLRRIIDQLERISEPTAGASFSKYSTGPDAHVKLYVQRKNERDDEKDTKKKP